MSALFDRDGDGQYDEAEANDKLSTELAFKKFDTDDSGSIDAGELAELVAELGGSLSPDELAKAMVELDVDGSTRIEMDEFIRWWLDMKRAGPGGGRGDDEEEDNSLRKKLRELAQKGRKRLGTDIHKASWEGNQDVVEAFLEANARLVDCKDTNDHGDDFRPLHYAAYQGHHKLCKYLLSRGADIDAQTRSGCTALFFASQQGHASVVKILLDNRASAALVESECGLGPLDVADSDAIRELFRSRGNYKRPRRPSAPTLALVPTKGSGSGSRSGPRASGTVGVSIRVGWDIDPPARDALLVTGFLVRVKDADSGEVAKTVDVVASIDDDEEHKEVRIGGLPGGTRLTAQVAAVNGLGRSKYSPASEPLFAPRRPNALGTLEVVEVLPTSVRVMWEEEDAENAPRTTAVVVEARRLGDTEAWVRKAASTTRAASSSEPRPTSSKFSAVCSVDGGQGVALLEKLSSGSVYRIRVRARNTSGLGEPSAAVEVETPLFEPANARGRDSTRQSRTGLLGSSGRNRGRTGGGSSKTQSVERASFARSEGKEETYGEGRFVVHDAADDF